MKIRKTLITLGLLALLANAARTQQATGSQDNKHTSVIASARSTTTTAASLTDDPDYVIGPEDVLNVNVWKEPEISVTAIPVRPDGKISLPLLHDVQAAGNTPTKLASIVSEQLRQFLTNPQVTVMVTASNSRRIYLIGEVVRPGALSMLPNMTVLQALSAGGGFSPFANLKKMYVLRNENGKQVKIPVNYKAVLGGQVPDQNIALKPGDTIVVP